MFRATLGGGAGGVGAEDGANSSRFSGGVGLASFAVGGAVVDNVALGVESFAVSFVEPTVTINGTKYETKNNVTLSTSGLGVMGSYYFMPVNVYFSGTLGLGRTTLEIPSSNQKISSDYGVAGNLKLGKEWMVSRHWGLGVAGTYLFASVPDGSTTLRTSVFGVAFSATYF